MSRRGISIEDIARVAGVSHSTVSRSLRNSPLISLEVRERIQLIAKEMKYIPNGIAQSLQTRQTKTIGLVFTSISDPFFGEVIRGVEEVAQSAGFSVLLCTSQNDPSQEIAAIETLLKRRVDGVLVADSRTGNIFKEKLKHSSIPTVLINNQTKEEGPLLHSISIEDRFGAGLAVEHLVKLGHRSIGYLGAGNRPRSNRLRLEGYQSALETAGIGRNNRWVNISAESDFRHEDDPTIGKKLLPDLVKAGVTAVFCHNDMLAVGALLACRDLELKVPQDLSIVGFDDIALAQFVTPPLTTIHQPMFDLGQHAMNTLLSILKGNEVENKVLKPYLVERESSGPPLFPAPPKVK